MYIFRIFVKVMEVMEIVVYVKKIIVYFDNFYLNINEIWFFFEDIVYEYE